MRPAHGSLAVLLCLLWPAMPALADPEEDRAAFRSHFQKRFPDIPVEEYVNGIYAIDEKARQQWMEIEEFPPYEFAVESGEALFAPGAPPGCATRSRRAARASPSPSGR